MRTWWEDRCGAPSYANVVGDDDAGEDCAGSEGVDERWREQHRRQEAGERDQPDEMVSEEAAEHEVPQKGPTDEEQRGAAEDGDGRGRAWMAERVVDDQWAPTEVTTRPAIMTRWA